MSCAECDRLVQAGAAILADELEQHRADLKAACGELLVPIPPIDDDPHNTVVRQLLRANAVMRGERDRARQSAAVARGAVMDLYNLALQHPGGASGRTAERYIAKLDAIKKRL